MKKISNYFLTILIIIFGIGLILFSQSNILAVQSSISLFVSAIFPSLFPFLIVTELLSHTTIISLISAKFSKIMPTLFSSPAIGAYPFVMGIISGYPVGAKIVANLRESNKITKIDGDYLLTFTNNAGPLFIIGSVGCGIYLNSSIGFLLYFIHFVSCIITGFIFGHFVKRNFRDNSITYSSDLNFSSFGEIVSVSIKKAFSTLSIVCGFVVIFSLIISMIQTSGILSFIHNSWIFYTLLGILEITSGIQLISTISQSSLFLNLVITAFLLGIGGISVLLQVWSVISSTDLSIKTYIFGKIFNGVVSASLMIIFLLLFPSFQFCI